MKTRRTATVSVNLYVDTFDQAHRLELHFREVLNRLVQEGHLSDWAPSEDEDGPLETMEAVGHRPRQALTALMAGPQAQDLLTGLDVTVDGWGLRVVDDNVQVWPVADHNLTRPFPMVRLEDVRLAAALEQRAEERARAQAGAGGKVLELGEASVVWTEEHPATERTDAPA